MKSTQAWGWLAAGVLALGLNGMYQDGGADWAHHAVNQVMVRISNRTEGILALAAGRADWFMAKAETVAERDQRASCPFATAAARFQAGIDRAQSRFYGFEAISDRAEARLARLEADRARVQARVAARVACVRMTSALFNPVVCPRVRVSIPQVRISIPEVRVETASLQDE